MNMLHRATYDCQRSKYLLEFLGGDTSKGRYTLPNIKIYKKTCEICLSVLDISVAQTVEAD